MKHSYTLTIVLLLLLPTLTFSQVEGNLHNRVGLRAGMNYSIVNGSINDNVSFKPGIYFAAYYQFRLGHDAGLLTELGYSQLGCKNSYQLQFSGVSGNTVLNLNYITLPITLKIYASKAFNFQMGLYGSALASATEKGTVKVKANNGYYGNLPNCGS